MQAQMAKVRYGVPAELTNPCLWNMLSLKICPRGDFRFNHDLKPSGKYGKNNCLSCIGAQSLNVLMFNVNCQSVKLRSKSS